VATTNWTAADNLQQGLPHTFAAMQKLIMAMEDAYKSRGKTTFFGHDRGLKAYQKFEDCLRETLLALSMDGLVKRTSSAEEYWGAIGAVINQWAEIFPNWPAAYTFANEMLGNKSEGQKLVAMLIRV
jgi:hypothetical protein